MKVLISTAMRSGSILFLTGFMAGCATPDSETVSSSSQLQAPAVTQEPQLVTQNAENCWSAAVLAGLENKSLSLQQSSETVLVLRSPVPSTSFAFAEVTPEIGDESDPEINDVDFGDGSDAGSKDGEGIGLGQGHEASFGEDC